MYFCERPSFQVQSTAAMWNSVRIMHCVTSIKKASKSLPSVSSQKNKYFGKHFPLRWESSIGERAAKVSFFALVRGRFIDWFFECSWNSYFFSPIVKLSGVLIGTLNITVFINVKSSSGPKLSVLSYVFAIEELKPATEPWNQPVIWGKSCKSCWQSQNGDLANAFIVL